MSEKTDNTNPVESFFRDFKTTLGFALTIIGLVIAYFSFDSYITSKIDEGITDTKYIKELSKTLRPFLIFDNNEVIVYDHGARKFVDSVRIDYFAFYKETKESNVGWPKEIMIYTNNILTTSPLLNHIGVYNFTYTSKRTKKGWLIKTKPVEQLWGESGRMKTNEELKQNMYILEILL
jgi:hypothetical protein